MPYLLGVGNKMAFTLSFDTLHNYDASKPGISLPVTLKLGTTAIMVEAKVDTGASYCIFARVFGEDLGLNIEGGSLLQFATATGSFTAYGHTINLSILGYEFDATVYFAADELFYRNVLGRHGWLNQVQMAIIDYDGKLFLSPYDLP
jgi:hypothetical protein